MIVRTPSKRLALLAALAALLGFVGGGAAWALVHLIELLTNLLLFHQWGTDVPPMETLDVNWSTYAVAVGGAIVISLLAKWAPVIRGHGIPETMEAVLTKQSRIAPRTATWSSDPFVSMSPPRPSVALVVSGSPNSA